jgi:hypothetical protein
VLFFHLVTLSAKVPDNEKKDFCQDTMEVFHGEFARLLSCPISLTYPGLCYYLFSEDEINSGLCECPDFAFVKLDNAKAQFQCPNIYCGRLWTSMRSRISFKITQPQSNGIVALKIYGQNCQDCGTAADALWYIGKDFLKTFSFNVFLYFRGSLSSDEKFNSINFRGILSFID